MTSVMSGSPSCQPSLNCGNGGRSAGSPGLQPVSAQRSNVSISVGEKRNASRKTPAPGCGFQGGIRPLAATSWRKVARLAASLYVRSEKGPICPGRWHRTQFRQRIGATCLVNVISSPRSSTFLFHSDGAIPGGSTSVEVTTRHLIGKHGVESGFERIRSRPGGSAGTSTRSGSPIRPR